MRQKVFFKTFGCRTNIYDTNIMLSKIKDFDITENENAADIIVINSCTVTNGADSSVKNYINKAQKMGVKVIVTGCGAISNQKEYREKNAVFGILGHSKKEEINSFLKLENPFVEIGDLKSIDKSIVSEYLGKTKAFIKIQEGCDFNCSYCIIPSVRGKARSQDESLILTQIKKLAQNGYGEFVLTGTNIGSYGRDKNTTLGKLLQKISQISGLRRIRLGSIEPSQVDESFMEILDESWLEKHLHIALQHTSEKMLKIMRRRNTTLRDLELFKKLSSKNFALGTDFIVAHPGESDEIWQEALQAFKKFPLTHIHAFIYSPRANTHSATLKNEIPKNIAKERLKTLEQIIKNNNINFRKNNKVPLEILIEEKRKDYFQGYDQFYNPIKIYSDIDISKQWINIKDYNIKEDINETTFRA